MHVNNLLHYYIYYCLLHVYSKSQNMLIDACVILRKFDFKDFTKRIRRQIISEFF